MSKSRMTLRIGVRSFDAASIQDASKVFNTARDASGEGASTWPDGVVVAANGVVLARISYNGKVWRDVKWTPGQEPLWTGVPA